MQLRALIVVAAAAAAAACGKFQSLELFAVKVPSIGTFEFAAVPAGVYRIGSLEGGPDEQPREVSIDGFYMLATEVTEKQFGSGTSRRPAVNVGLDQARAFCRRLSEASGLEIRLPTDEEWEIAARGGVRGARYAWGWGDPAGRAVFRAHGPARVSSMEPNGYYLYDMSGNVAEWCESGAVRGGSWSERDPVQLQVYRRTLVPAGYVGVDVGFRVVLKKEENTD